MSPVSASENLAGAFAALAGICDVMMKLAATKAVAAIAEIFRFFLEMFMCGSFN
jgi:hypothetical protein